MENLENIDMFSSGNSLRRTAFVDNLSNTQRLKIHERRGTYCASSKLATLRFAVEFDPNQTSVAFVLLI